MEIKNTKTCESVGMGHPDKICDQISDGVLDACLAIDKNSRVACECFACNHLIVIGGEITTDAVIDPVKIAWKILKRLEYTENDFTIISNINKQSSDISKLVDKGENALSSSVGAGDQGITVGYATNETTAFLPLEYDIATKLVQKATELKDKNIFIDAKYDMKSQVTITYDSNHQPTVDTVVFSIQHHAFKSDSDRSKFKTFIKEEIILPIIKSYKLNTDFKYYINYVGDFVIGGPFGDTGLTGRKLMVDNYGPSVQHGGGAFSGKDYTKVDRTGAYYARWIAKNIVAAKLCDRCEIQLGWCIGVSKPVAIQIECFNTQKIDIKKIENAIIQIFDMSLFEIIMLLELQNPIYMQTSYFGHFTKDNLPWEKTNYVNKILEVINK